ncbi:MAG: wax ester/triacylglycerol synthase family O-acyltransferase [Nannocystis sp.]|nr:wax ester/triacylglycerol synthase family O-acyltransferase [Nannocystis sp.]MBA3550350.1 wax ester/triacylglycerol synthase family O-acyltransferase [Nannocystis sp.]
MTGIDASFLYMEAPNLPMHTLKLGILDLAGAHGPFRFERVIETLRAHMHLLPRLRWRAVPVPLGIHHPVWVEDPNFEVAAHVRRVTLPPPGGPMEFDALIARIAEDLLDRSRPLWELWMVEGVHVPGHGGPLIGFVTKVHHAVADGVAAMEMLRRAMVALPVDGVDRIAPGPLPGRAQLLRTALADHLRQLTGLPALLGHTARALMRVRSQRRSAEVRAPFLFTGPRTGFNQPLSRHRRFARVELSLKTFREIKTQLGCTINDVVLAVVAGALRSYLLGRGESVDERLVAAVPATTLPPGRAGGNHVTSMYTSLCIDIADPLARLRAIQRITDNAKQRHEALGGDLLERWLEFTRLAPHRLLWHHIVPRLRHPPIHAVVSNVPGPREPLTIEGARLVHLASIGPLIEGAGINFTAWCYVDVLCVSVLTCADAVPDLHVLTDALRMALGELQAVSLRLEEGLSSGSLDSF